MSICRQKSEDVPNSSQDVLRPLIGEQAALTKAPANDRFLARRPVLREAASTQVRGVYVYVSSWNHMGSGQPAGSDPVPEVEPERRHGESDWSLTGRKRAGESRTP